MQRVLIVDDERQIRRIVSVVLEARHHRVEEAASGEEALDRLEAFAPDVVLLDLNLPGISGLETVERIRERDPSIHVVMMTAYGTIRSAVEAMRAGAFDYLTKPFDNDELLLTLDRVFEMRRLGAEVTALRDALEARYGFNEIVGQSTAMQQVFRQMKKVSRVDATVLVTGESGTGKELVARAIHRTSTRAEGRFVDVNCSAIPEALVESHFFGHEKGAFTDARTARVGAFEQAHGGTLFLDEIGDLALEAQAKLLRALQERQVVPVGGNRSRDIDVRVIAATHVDLEQAVAEGRFRDDLFWRIHVVNIALPPLRDRAGDLPLLIDLLIDRFNLELATNIRAIADEAREKLLTYAWPGNVRELENTICRAMILCEGSALTVADLPPRITSGGSASVEAETGIDGSEPHHLADAVRAATERLEQRMIRERLKRFRGRRAATAESLGVSRKTLFNKMRQYGLDDLS